jgi:Protein of unknown function (DUF3435)
MIVIAILGNAFELEFQRAEDILKLRVKKPRTTMRLRWKAAWETKPVFRQAVPTVDGVKMSKTEPLRYHTFLYYLLRLGMMVGMMMILNPYNIQRGTGEAVEGEFHFLCLSMALTKTRSGWNARAATAGHEPQGRRNFPSLHQRAHSM